MRCLDIMSERTLSIIKPDAVSRNLIGKINAVFEENGLKIVGQRMTLLNEWAASRFYMEHSEKPFFKDLVKFMTSSPVVVQVLEGPNAIMKNRTLIGATNPSDAAEGTIRRMYGTSIQMNCVHGSDSLNSVDREIAFFFASMEIFSGPF